jgi:stage II sporulation protein D
MGPAPASAADAATWSTSTLRFEAVGAGTVLAVAGLGTYRGAVEVRRNGASLAVVNDVALEDYVRGIDEVPPSWPEAALQAQAIAARTYVLNKAAGSDATPWRAVGADICATSTCQVYNGLAAERRAAGYGWLAAVEATAGRVLLSGGRPIVASYSATANGPLAMSQNGAYDMAVQGRSAPEILASYYGIRPTLAPPGLLPATVRVALTTATRSVRVTSSGPVRVLAADGSELATSGAGEWRVDTGDGGMRLVAPDGPGAAAAADGASEVAAVARRPGRAMTAATPLPSHGPWPAVAGALVLATAAGAGTTLRRRFSDPGSGPGSRAAGGGPG